MLGGVCEGTDELGSAELPEGITMSGPPVVGTLSTTVPDTPAPTGWIPGRREPLSPRAGSLLVLLDRADSLALKPSEGSLLP